MRKSVSGEGEKGLKSLLFVFFFVFQMENVGNLKLLEFEKNMLYMLYDDGELCNE